MALKEGFDLLGAFFVGESADAIDEITAGANAAGGLVEELALDFGKLVDVAGRAAPPSLGVAPEHAKA